MATVQVWFRAGITLNVSPEQAKEILIGDQEALETALKPKRFWNFFKRKKAWRFDGDAYIPDVISKELCEQLGLDPKVYSGDIEFNL